MIRAKIGVGAIKIKNYLFILSIFNYFKITTTLKTESVRSQDLSEMDYSGRFYFCKY